MLERLFFYTPAMKRFLLVLSLGLLVAVGWGAYVLFTGFEKSFPPLGPGLYVGSIRLADGTRVIPWFVERLDKDVDPLVLVVDPRYQAQRISLGHASGTSRAPLIVTGDGSRLRLSGREADATELEGHVLDPITGEEGVWNLVRTAVQQQLTPEQASELRSWFSIRRDVDKLDEQLEALRLKSDSQRARMDKFQRYVFNDNSLKETAASRLGSTAGSIQAVRTEVDSLRAKLDESIRALETAEHVSPAGNLVVLSREALQRESRWIELTLRLLAPETTAGFEQSLERAYRVKTLQDRIADERRKLADLDNESDLRSYENEEEFYREMGQ
jgi:hypothetical protein